jgi:parvulin-like peptidyl-prolyl isomerase
MAKKKRKQTDEESREETRKEKRIKARDRERNRKIYLGTAVVLGLVILVLLIGVFDQFIRKPNSPVATAGDEKISAKAFQERALYQENQLVNQYQQMSQLEQQFGGQGIFASQLAQIEATLSSPFAMGSSVLDQLVNEAIIRQEAEKRGVTVSDEEVEQALRDEVAAGQGAVTEPQATQTAEAAIEATATAELWTPTPAPTLDVSAALSETEAVSGSVSGAAANEAPTPAPLPTRPILTDEQYQEGLTSLEDRLNAISGMSLDDYREIIRARLLAEKLTDIIGEEEVSPTEEEVHARHILLRVEEPAPDLNSGIGITETVDISGLANLSSPVSITATDEISGLVGISQTASVTESIPTGPMDDAAALALAKKLRQRILDGEDFAELAAEYSQDPGSAANGGDLGWFGRGAMVPEFEDAAFSLAVGEVSEPVRTQFGWHLIDVVEKDDARPKDEATLQREKQQAFQQWLQEQVVAYNVDRADDLVDRLPDKLGQAAGALQRIPAQPAAPVAPAAPTDAP